MVRPTGTTSYRGASSHYLSPGRRDPVKRLWEEPVNHRLLASAIDALPAARRPLRVLDVGAGTGDGLALLESSLARTATPERPLRYTGLDPDGEMIATAQALHRDRTDAEFVRGDVRDKLPTDDVDLYLSAGVPYSHLRHADFDEALTRILTSVARRRGPAAVVIDVLGRYSLEWVSRWGRDQWDYPMSFFEGTAAQDAITAPMSFHDRWSVAAALRRARERAAVDVLSVEYHDRSVMVGRHTTTGTFHPGLPNYRGLVNRLHEGDPTVDLDALRVAVPRGPAPGAVAEFFGALAPMWNACLDRAREDESRTGAGARSRTRLAARLCALETGIQQGLGAAHTLICVAIVAPRA